MAVKAYERQEANYKKTVNTIQGSGLGLVLISTLAFGTLLLLKNQINPTLVRSLGYTAVAFMGSGVALFATSYLIKKPEIPEISEEERKLYDFPSVEEELEAGYDRFVESDDEEGLQSGQKPNRESD